MAHLINRVAVIGSGTMGARSPRICERGHPAYLLDIAPNKLTPEEEKKGLTLKDPAVRNRIVNAGLDAIKKARPAGSSLPRLSSASPSATSKTISIYSRSRLDHRGDRRKLKIKQT